MTFDVGGKEKKLLLIFDKEMKKRVSITSDTENQQPSKINKMSNKRRNSNTD